MRSSFLFRPALPFEILFMVCFIYFYWLFKPSGLLLTLLQDGRPATSLPSSIFVRCIMFISMITQCADYVHSSICSSDPIVFLHNLSLLLKEYSRILPIISSGTPPSTWTPKTHMIQTNHEILIRAGCKWHKSHRVVESESLSSAQQIHIHRRNTFK